MYAIVRHNGYLWKIRKNPVETNEMAQDRAWYVALNMDPSVSSKERESVSRMWANQKYYQMEYQNDGHTKR